MVFNLGYSACSFFMFARTDSKDVFYSVETVWVGFIRVLLEKKTSSIGLVDRLFELVPNSNHGHILLENL